MNSRSWGNVLAGIATTGHGVSSPGPGEGREGGTMLRYTNENFYEVIWGTRERILDRVLAQGVTGRKAALDALMAFEATHDFTVQTPWETDPETGEQVRMLNGEVDIAELSGPEMADRQGFLGELKARTMARMKYLSGQIPPRADTIVELGCGYGVNLFLLAELIDPAKVRFVAAEYTESGRRLCSRLAAMDPALPLETAFIDHKAPDLSFLGESASVAFFTCHSIEQVEEIPATYFATLAAAAPRVFAAHLEPFGFQVDGFTPANSRQKGCFQDSGWNRNFYAALKAAEGAGTLRLRRLEPEKFFVQPGNPTSVATWDNRL